MELALHFLDDDYAINRFHQLTLTAFAEKNNCSVEFFDDSKILLDEYKENSVLLPDLLFLDINMPVIDGWLFLNTFNQLFPDAKTKIAILTTSNNPSYIQKSLNYSNVLSFELKPLKEESLEHLLSLIKSDNTQE